MVLKKILYLKEPSLTFSRILSILDFADIITISWHFDTFVIISIILLIFASFSILSLILFFDATLLIILIVLISIVAENYLFFYSFNNCIYYYPFFQVIEFLLVLYAPINSFIA